MNHAISGEIFVKEVRFPQSEILFATLPRPWLKMSESQWRNGDWDWKGLSLNDETETEKVSPNEETKTETEKVSDFRPRPQNFLDQKKSCRDFKGQDH